MKYGQLYFLAITLLLAGFTNSAIAQSKAEQVSDLLKMYHDYDQFNGSALVATNGKVIHSDGYGWANMEWEIENSSDTKHRLGSVTKQFTAMLIMQLVEEGKVKLHAPISTYVPEYSETTGDKITLHHLLTHSSGIPNYTSFPGFFQEQSRDPYSPEEFLAFFADSTLNFEPGSSFDYSNSGYFLLGYIIETIRENSYENELQERIFEPLGMANTGYDHHGDILAKRATGYERQGLKYINAPFLDMTIPYAAGSLYSTVEDLFVWDQALYTEKLISKKTRDLMFEEHVEAFGGHYAYGWVIRNDDGSTEINHGGGINGFNTIISRFPDSKDVVILLNNTGGTDLEKMAKGIKSILEGKTYDKPKRSVARAVYGVIEDKGLVSGLDHLSKIKDDKNFELDEREINAMGYEFLGSNRIEEALAIFKVNSELYPESWNVYDSYGEALLMSGNNEAAIENYKKSVDMNPGNVSGLRFLEKLGASTSDLVKEVVVDDAVLKSYVGEYELQPGFIITITKDGSQLSGQATGQGSNPIYPRNDHEFYLKVVDAQVVFNRNDSGEVESLTLKQGGREMPGKKIK